MIHPVHCFYVRGIKNSNWKKLYSCTSVTIKTIEVTTVSYIKKKCNTTQLHMDYGINNSTKSNHKHHHYCQPNYVNWINPSQPYSSSPFHSVNSEPSLHWGEVSVPVFHLTIKVITINLYRSSITKKGCLLFVGCLMSQQHASVSQGQICRDNFTCCHTEQEVATFYLTQSQYTDIGPASPSADPIGSVATGVPIFKSQVWLDPKTSRRKQDLNPRSSTLEATALTTKPMRRSLFR